EQDFGSKTTATSIQERQHSPQASQDGRVLFCRRRRRAYSYRRPDTHSPTAWRSARWTGPVTPGVQRYRGRSALAYRRCPRAGVGARRNARPEAVISGGPKTATKRAGRGCLAAEELTAL